MKNFTSSFLNFFVRLNNLSYWKKVRPISKNYPVIRWAHDQVKPCQTNTFVQLQIPVFCTRLYWSAKSRLENAGCVKAKLCGKTHSFVKLLVGRQLAVDQKLPYEKIYETYPYTFISCACVYAD